MSVNRRGFLKVLGVATAAAVAGVIDPERLLWTPGAKTFFLPPVVTTVTRADVFYGVDWGNDNGYWVEQIIRGNEKYPPKEYWAEINERQREYNYLYAQALDALSLKPHKGGLFGSKPIEFEVERIVPHTLPFPLDWPPERDK